MGAEARIGTVSSVDPETGMVQVLYRDRDGEVTQPLPYATFNDEFRMPFPGARVLVLHLSNGSGAGVVLGTYWHRDNPAGAPGVYHKDLGGGAYLDYDGETLTIAAEHIRLASLNGVENCQDFEVEELLQELRDYKQQVTDALEEIRERLSQVEAAV